MNFEQRQLMMKLAHTYEFDLFLEGSNSSHLYGRPFVVTFKNCNSMLIISKEPNKKFVIKIRIQPHPTIIKECTEYFETFEEVMECVEHTIKECYVI